MKTLRKRVGRVAARANGSRGLHRVVALRALRPDRDPEEQLACMRATERAAWAEATAHGLPNNLLLAVTVGDDGMGLAEGGRRWKVLLDDGVKPAGGGIARERLWG